MIARNRIWIELKQAKSNIICLQRYTDRGRKRLRIFDSAIILLSTAGALGSGVSGIIWIAVIASGLIALGSILKSILPNITQSEQELSELDRLMDFYSKYMNNLEKLWYEYDKKNIDERTMIMQLFEMKKDEADKYSALNKGIRSISKKKQAEIDKESENYINEVYFKIEENE
ncbi:MAG: hypothetical protein LBJ63_05250 [Prevotellaceae bacterium]|jgi:hypothetical protein|nr:hypothetical protein [Prevotellaceae bacterium]